jgi:hypothetical protein
MPQVHGHVPFPEALDPSVLFPEGGHAPLAPGPARQIDKPGGSSGSMEVRSPSETAPPDPARPFLLVAVVVHAGGASSGHYWAYCRAGSGAGAPGAAAAGGGGSASEWFRASDRDVVHVPLSEELGCAAAALVYERR